MAVIPIPESALTPEAAHSMVHFLHEKATVERSKREWEC